jgi:hypothetical protein
MTRAEAASIALLGVAMAFPCTGHAAPKVQGVGETSVGYTDNSLSAPDTAVPGGSAKVPSVFLVLAPAVVVAAVSQRSIQRIKYAYTYDLIFEQANASTSSNQLDYRGFFDLSPRVGLVLGAAAVQSSRNAAMVLSPPGAGAVGALPAGSGAFLSVSVDELLSLDLAPRWRAYESVMVIEDTPIFDTVAPRTFAPGGRIGVERSFERDAVGLEARADYSVVEGIVRADGTAAGTQQQIIGTGLGLWRHDWGRVFTSRVEAGALRVERLNTGRGFWEPTGSAALAYVAPLGAAELAYAHTVTTNPTLGQTFLVDEVRLRGAVPLTKKADVVVAASAGYEHSSVLDENTDPAAHVDAVLADVGVGWQVTAALLLGLRYQHFEQVSDATEPQLPVSFARNSVLAGATFKFPPESDMPRAYRAPRRVDRSDEIREGVAPAGSGASGRSKGPGI